MRFKAIVILIVTVLLSLNIYAYNPVQDINQSMGLIKNFAGSKDAIENNISKPITSPTPMKNLEGSLQFDAQIQCPANTKAITISFVPENTMKGWNVIIKQDSDMNGSYDHTLTFKISGACAKGFIQGNYGQQVLSYFKFISNNGKINYTQAQDTSEVGSCVCAQQPACGNIPPYDILGGAVMGVLMQDGKFIYGKSEWDLMTMTFNIYGQSRVNCSGINVSDWNQYGEQNPSHYYNSGQYPQVSLGDIALQQGSDPNSYYTLLTNEQVQTNLSSQGIGLPNIAECTITRAPQCVANSTNYQWVETNGCQEFESRQECKIKEEEIDGITIIHNYIQTGNIPTEVCDQTTCTYEENQTQQWFKSGGEGATCSATCSCEACDNPDGCNCSCTCSRYFEDIATITASWGNNAYLVIDDINITYRTYGITCGGYNHDAHITQIVTLPDNTVIKREKVVDSYAGDNLCKPFWVGQACGYHWEFNEACGSPPNRVYQLSYTETGAPNTVKDKKVQLARALYTEHTNASWDITVLLNRTVKYKQTHNTCSWRLKKRQYVCGEVNIDVDLSRSKTVMQTANPDTATAYDPVSGSMNYSDYTQYKGNSCSKKYCMVKTDYQNLSVYGDQTNAVQAGQQNSKQYEVRECTPNCPVRPGESIEQDCNCGEIGAGFSLAISTMEAVNQAAKDMICSMQ